MMLPKGLYKTYFCFLLSGTIVQELIPNYYGIAISANITTEFEKAMVAPKESYIKSLWELTKVMQKKAITNKPPLNPSIHFSECKLNA